MSLPSNMLSDGIMNVTNSYISVQFGAIVCDGKRMAVAWESECTLKFSESEDLLPRWIRKR